jgi:hypothetical protein
MLMFLCHSLTILFLLSHRSKGATAKNHNNEFGHVITGVTTATSHKKQQQQQ